METFESDKLTTTCLLILTLKPPTLPTLSFFILFSLFVLEKKNNFSFILSICFVFREIDRDGDGRVSYRDFEFMMKFRLADGF